MPSLEIEFEVFCERCGAGLCMQTTTEQDRNGNKITVEPCQNCLDVAHDEGFEKGENITEERMKDDIEDARQEGYEQGYDEGFQNGLETHEN